MSGLLSNQGGGGIAIATQGGDQYDEVDITYLDFQGVDNAIDSGGGSSIYVFDTEHLSGVGAVTVALTLETSRHFLENTGADATTTNFTLADGELDGQIHYFINESSNSAKLVKVTPASVVSGEPTDWTTSAAKASLKLIWNEDSGGWMQFGMARAWGTASGLATVAVDGVTVTGTGVIGNPLVAPVPAIGGTLTSATAGSVLFAGAATFAQDNANLFYDDTNNWLGIGITAPLTKLHVKSGGGIEAINVENSNAAGYAAIAFIDSGGNAKLSMGYANAGTGFGSIISKIYMLTVGPDIVFSNLSGTGFTFGMTNNSVKFEMHNGASSAVSTAGTGAFRYNSGTDKIQYSKNGAAWVDLV